MVSRRTALRMLATGSVLGTSGCATVAHQLGDQRRAEPGGEPIATSGGEQSGQSGGVDAEYRAAEPTGAITDATIPSSPEQYEYATMGPADAEVVTLFGNWKCPYTREFVVQDFPGLVQSYVETGRVAIEFRTLAYQDGEPHLGPDAPRAAWAGLAVWAHDPDSFWPYFATVFQNQPPERDAWATTTQLEAFMQTAGVQTTDPILADVRAGERDPRVRETSDAATRYGIDTIPRLVYDGRVVAPNLDLDAAHDLLERAATADDFDDGFGDETTTTEDGFGEETTTTTEDGFGETTTTDDGFGETTTTEDDGFGDETTTEDDGFGDDTTTENTTTAETTTEETTTEETTTEETTTGETTTDETTTSDETTTTTTTTDDGFFG